VIKEKDEVAYFVALISGTFAVLHDKSSGGQIGVPMQVLPKIARASECLDAERWWEVPTALQSGIWASVPGSGPEGVDGWPLLLEAAEKGAQSGVRVAWGIAALLASNGDQEEILVQALEAHGKSLTEVEADPKWLFFDQYATEVSLQQSDKFWIKERGYRTPRLGEIPKMEEEIITAPSEEDPFGADPFQ